MYLYGIATLEAHKINVSCNIDDSIKTKMEVSGGTSFWWKFEICGSTFRISSQLTSFISGAGSNFHASPPEAVIKRCVHRTYF